jgi:DNA-directed RNA polymerase specialized sigma24 family protein
MSSNDSVSAWIGLLKAGEAAAAQPLWERYFERLVGLARAKLLGTARRVADEEDVALSAFDSFCRGARIGRFPQLLDRDNLWRLLVVITARKASCLRRDQHRLKRGGPAGAIDEEAEVERLLSEDPTPEFAAQTAEECQRLLGALGKSDLRQVVLWKLEGFTNEEIAQRLGCAERSVERKLRLIRELWEGEGLA